MEKLVITQHAIFAKVKLLGFPLPNVCKPHIIIVADIRKLYYNATLLHKAYIIML